MIQTHTATHKDIEISVDSSLPPPPTPRLLQEAINAYELFHHNRPYSLFHIGHLRNHVHESPRYFQYALVATAVRYSDLHISDEEVLPHGNASVLRYALVAWRSINMPWANHSDSIVYPVIQTIHLLALIDFIDGKCSTAWIKLGMAIRLSQYMRLNMEPQHDGSMSPLLREERRRVLWSLYLLDRLISCSRSRPPTIADDDCQTYLPATEQEYREANFTEQRLTLQQVLKALSLHSELRNSSSFTKIVIASTILGRVSRYVMQDCTHSDAVVPWSPQSTFSDLEASLLDFESCVSTSESLASGEQDNECTGHLVFARMLFHLSYCLLNHPFIMQQRLSKLDRPAPQIFLKKYESLAQAHARWITTEMTHVSKTHDHMLASFFTYCQTVAGSVHASMNAMHFPTIDIIDNEDEALYHECKANLNAMSSRWPCAVRMVSFSHRMKRKWSLISSRRSTD
jgi:hypothetical protein